MAYWLMKSEPDAYSIDDLARDGCPKWIILVRLRVLHGAAIQSFDYLGRNGCHAHGIAVTDPFAHGHDVGGDAIVL